MRRASFAGRVRVVVDLPALPVLKPALRVLWRDDSTLQLGIEARHAVVLDGVTRADKTVLALLDGSRGVDALLTAARDHGVDADVVHRLLETLSAAGVLEDAAASIRWRSELDRQRLAPDGLSLSLLHRDPGAAARVLAVRSSAVVAVHGTGRVGAQVATLLAAAGVGDVSCVDSTPLSGADLAPGGIPALRAGTRGAAAADRIAELVPTARVATSAPAAVTLAVVTATTVPSPEVVVAVRDHPHLFVLVRETCAVVGPLVVPGRSTCWRCVQIARADRDPAWPALSAQLSGDRAAAPLDIALGSLAASLAAVEALHWVDTRHDVTTVGGVLELDLADGRLRRRSVTPHPDCGCGAAADHAVMAWDGEDSGLTA